MALEPLGGRFSRRSFLGRSAVGIGAVVPVLGGLPRRSVASARRVAAPSAIDVGPLPDAPWDDVAYWAFADRMQERLDALWSDAEGVYLPTGGGETTFNACMLLTHAVAAMAGHTGGSRQDLRARRLAWRLCQSPPFRVAPPASQAAVQEARHPGQVRLAQAVADEDALLEPQPHPGGWGGVLKSFSGQHAMVDSQVTRALAQTWLARHALGLESETVALIVDRVASCAGSAFHAYPALRLNQINWPIDVYMCGATVTGDPSIVQRDGFLQYERFATAITQVVDGFTSPFLGAGYRFHYLPQRPEDHAWNLDSAEYATMVCGALEHYEPAVALGMSALEPEHEARLRTWVDRVLCGYWTHAGYLNWDTGLAFERWHSGKKVGLSVDALFAIATAERFQPDPEYGDWAKWMLDRGLRFYDQLATAAGGLAPAVLFGVTKTAGSVGDARLWGARMQASAARAISKGFGSRRASSPPALYAYDPDTGRLAVTTPVYNTAVFAVSQGRLPYGGVELARLYDAQQRVVANIGGRPPASFGVMLRDATGRELASQRGRAHPDLLSPPLRLTQAPYGAEPQPQAYPDHAYAGRFEELEATGVTSSDDASIVTTHRFLSESIETSWTIDAHGPGPYTVQVLFPTWGPTAAVDAQTRAGTSVALGDAPIALDDVASFRLEGEEAGYLVVPSIPLPPGTAAKLLPTVPQASAPRCGPTLALESVNPGPLTALQIAVQIVPTPAAA